VGLIFAGHSFRGHGTISSVSTARLPLYAGYHKGILTADKRPQQVALLYIATMLMGCWPPVWASHWLARVVYWICGGSFRYLCRGMLDCFSCMIAAMWSFCPLVGSDYRNAGHLRMCFRIRRGTAPPAQSLHANMTVCGALGIFLVGTLVHKIKNNT